MHLPEPTLTLTLPSIHDGTILDCRIYHPLSPSSELWHPRHAAVVAHPYAPLGGSYNDPMVAEVATQFLWAGFITATFNFRGAGNSTGRTSWTSRPERDDYTSIVGFLVYYVHSLDPRKPGDAEAPILVLSGYSYGAMITSQLPPIEAVMAVFANPPLDSDAGHIRTLAETLAHQQRRITNSHGIRVGETSPRRRSSSIGDGSIRGIARRTRHRARSSLGSINSINSSATSPTSPQQRQRPDLTLPLVSGLVRPQPAYLLISPLQGPITNLVTISRSPGHSAAEAQLRIHPTLAVYGDGDIFVSVKRLRAWTERMENAQDSKFRGREIPGAGHFWIEEGVLSEMMRLVADFVKQLLGPG
ncbi:hypothetical protein GMORB2_3211 [Geosmithia morbida]|uniref:AB hydrolase-1 domain-containing protein n=1 Tax=Geosmithia morbida TaxID=1094350 RepID=A0A9P5D230_9HYPO|nr:uncharacterized protein GMORB2_3211 [Geosmithia morbida]KAF4120410.1 hypothetical protein GMORB2_3211 [Geosmithia morbida]